MGAAELLKNLSIQGITIRLSDDGANLVVPKGCLSDSQRQELREHKLDIIEILWVAKVTTEHLIVAAMKACDYFHDGPAARQQMRDDCINTPLHLQSDLLEHFQQTYGHPDRYVPFS